MLRAVSQSDGEASCLCGGKQSRFASADVPAEKQLCAACGFKKSRSLCGCCCVRLLLQVCVPKNTVVVVTREKGGFLSVLQSSLSTGAEPDPRLAEVRWGTQGGRQQLGLSVHCSACLYEQSLANSTGRGRVTDVVHCCVTRCCCRCPPAWPPLPRVCTPRAGPGWHAHRHHR